MDQTIHNANKAAQANSFYIQPKCYLSKDGEYLNMLLPGNMVVRKHVNYFKQIFGVVYTPKKRKEG